MLATASYEHVPPAAAAYGDASCPQHAFASFLDRRPLGWRAGLPPSAMSLGLDRDDSHTLRKAAAIAVVPVSAHTLRRSHSVRVAADDATERLRYDAHDFVKSTVWANHDRLQLRVSALEGAQNPRQKALFIRPDAADGTLPLWLRTGECLHIHADGTAHMLLSLADAGTAVARGWATTETRTAATMPGYVVVHAPRSADELAVWKRLAMASMRYCTYPWQDNELRRPERLC